VSGLLDSWQCTWRCGGIVATPDAERGWILGVTKEELGDLE